jgi:hypothetical protein
MRIGTNQSSSGNNAGTLLVTDEEAYFFNEALVKHDKQFPQF